MQELYNNNQLIDPNNLANKDRLNLGSLVHALTVPDPITGVGKTIQTYDELLFNDPGKLSVSNNTADDVEDVNGDQYIDLRIAEIENTGGTLNVNLGDRANKHTDATNKLTLAAKQSTLFEVDGHACAESVINWDTNNRVHFNAGSASSIDERSYSQSNFVDYKGAFDVTTLDGEVHSFNVTDLVSLTEYNEFLKAELASGNLEGTNANYKSLFDLAVTISSGTIKYEPKASTPGDEIFEGQGDRLVIHATGANAKANINAVLDIDVGYSNSGQSGVLIENGAQIKISENGLLGSRNNQALSIKNGASGINDGVINGNFTTKGVTHTDTGPLADGSVVLDGKSHGLATAVNLEGSTFTNNGVLNLNGSSTTATGTAIGIDLKDGSEATNTGSINVGVANSSQSNTTLGVRVAGADDKFTNSGEIYIGRGPQANKDDDTASTEIALNQRYTTMGIRVDDNGTAINKGDITIGSKVQNAAAMGVIGGDDVSMVNEGNINILGNAAATPNMNYGILVMNSGLNGGIKNDANISLSGVNAIGIQVLSTAGKKAYASTTENSTILIEGGRDPESNTRNYSVWVEGQGTGQSSADIDGDIILRGDGAIGVHARGNAEVTVHADSVPKLETGEQQIAFFAYGNNAKIVVGGAQDFDVSTKKSTFFRIENGADFKENGLALKASTEGSIGINGTGLGTEIELSSASIITSGTNSTGVIIEGGATGQFDQATTIQQTGNQSTAVVVDGIKHNLAGGATTAGAGSNTVVISSAQINSDGALNTVTGLVGYDVKNGGILLNRGDIDYALGTNHIGVKLSGTNTAKPSQVQNNGTIHINHGTGIDADGKGTHIVRAGQITVDDGIAGIRLTNGAKAVLVGDSNTIITKGSAHGIFLDVAAESLAMSESKIDILGRGNGVENTAETADIHIVNSTINVRDGSGIRTATQINPNSSAIINVSGKGSGFGFKRADGNTTDQDLQLDTGYQINVTGAQGIGIEALTTGIVSTSANVNVTNTQGGPALLAGTAASTTNIGNLISQSNSSSVVNLTNGTGTNFDNVGNIVAKTHAHSAVLGSSGDDTLTFTEGNVRGEINSGAGSDFILISGGTLEGGISMEGSGGTTYIKGIDLSKTYHAQAALGNNTLILDGISARGGSFAEDDLSKGTNFNKGWDSIQLTNNTEFTLTDNLTLEGHYVNIDGTSTLLAGNNVNATISAGNPSALTVLNSGSIDLTNGGTLGDTLTIKGNYQGKELSTGPSPFMLPSDSLLKINTMLNAGGVLSNQITDRLLIEKDVSGTTYVTVVSSGLGGITDLNRDAIIQANEGISIIQVGGASAFDAFTLREPVLAGAYAYGFYGFAPGQSDASQRLVAGSGNSFWDYRLANAFVCPIGEVCTDGGTGGVGGVGGNSRPQLTPQMPSYISLPLGVALYNTITIDDLHKRLGEVRHDLALDKDETGELYIRYVGVRNKYHSNVSFKNYGYDFNLDVNAFQIGSNLFKFNTDNNDIFRGGIAWIHGNSTLKPKSVDGYSKTKLDSNTFALYATWLKENGFYIDGVVAYNKHKANVQTASRLQRDHDLKARGWLASIETGYPFKFGNGVVLEPQAQLTYQSVKVKNFKDINSANLRYDNFDQTTLRLGVRGYKTWVTEKGNQITPYVRINYYQNFGGGSKLYVATNNAGYDGQMDIFRGGKGGKMVQVGIGGTASFKNDFSIFGEVDYQKNLGSHGSKGLRLNIGAKWAF